MISDYLELPGVNRYLFLQEALPQMFDRAKYAFIRPHNALPTPCIGESKLGESSLTLKRSFKSFFKILFQLWISDVQYIYLEIY